MANTTIQIKKSSVPGNKPLSLANGELAINFADGKLFYNNTTNQIAEFAPAAGFSFGSVSANGTLLVADVAADVLTIAAGNNINIVAAALTDRLTISLSDDVVIPSSGSLKVNAVGGDEGGEIKLANAITNSGITTDVIIDIFQNQLRFFESGGTNRGAFINLAIASAGVGSNLLAASAGSTDTTARTIGSSAFDKANAANVLAFNALPNVSGVSTAGTLVIPTGNLNIGASPGSAKLYVFASGGNTAAVVYGSLGGVTVDYQSSSQNYYEANLHSFKSGTTGPNSERMRIDDTGVTANGNVIIRSHGTAQLSIESDADNVNEFEQARLYLKQDGGGTVMRMGFRDGSNDFEFMHEGTGNGLRFGANNNTHMVMDVLGNVSIGATSTQYKLEVIGSFAATTKSFVIPHPTKENFKLRYGSLEGPENGVYLRGRSKRMTIELPEYWEKLVDPDSITVNITPIDRKQELFVKSVTSKKVVLGGGRKPDFFFTVFAERKDVPKLVVEYE